LTHDSTSGGQAHPEKKKRDVNTIKSTTITTAGTGVVHPFFSSKPTPTLGHFQNSPATVVHFLHLDPFLSSSEGESSTTRKPIEIVFYDLDGTLIKTRANTSGFPKDRADWQWWDPSVPGRLKREWEQGKHLVVLSNQGHTSPKVKAEWRAKLPLIAAKVIPFVNESE
jgi:bifunctional polynucleotide phosphatase/kinase